MTQIPMPGFLLNPVIKAYSAFFKINPEEIQLPEKGFRTFDQFFTRLLIPGARKIDQAAKTVVSPVDARIDQFGKIKNTTLIQAKGMEYSINDLIPSETSEKFANGHFITLYLSPADYHRIHSPVTGKVTGYFHIPGKLFPVQEFITANIKKLFSVNERVLTYVQSKKGITAVCMVGAMNVGRISLSYSSLVTNRFIRLKKEIKLSKDEQPAIKKGDELGIFHLGSTVILLFQKDMIKFTGIKTGQKVKVGQRIADFVD